MKKQLLKGGMVGGALGSFIGPVHRMAALMDGQARFVAGAFSRNKQKAKETGEALFIEPSRLYDSWEEMLERESAKPRDERLDFVSIVTNTASHYAIASAFVDAGFHVICDKPMTTRLDEAIALKAKVNKAGAVFALTHNYTGYPMVKQARHMVRGGELGVLNKIVIEYSQGWLASLLENGASGINMWRLDPQEAGKSCCVADIGIHAENLCRYITGLEIESVCADVSSFIPGNRLEDDVTMLLRFKGGAKGTLTASQIAAGDENDFNIRIYGSQQGMLWRQEDPNYLVIKHPSGMQQRLSKGNPQVLCDAANRAGRLPFGHPDGFIEAFANLYLEAFRAIRAHGCGESLTDWDCPGIDDGIAGLRFIDTVLKSGVSQTKWTPMVSLDDHQ